MDLKAITEENRQVMLDLLTNHAVKKTYMLPDFERQEDAIPLFHRFCSLSLDEKRFVRGIFVGPELVGFLNDVEIKEHAMEVGYVIHPEYHNRGYMTVALSLAINELFEKGYEEVICGAFEGNKASLRVMQKAGMKLLERTDDIEYRGKVHRCIYYGFKNEE